MGNLLFTKRLFMVLTGVSVDGPCCVDIHFVHTVTSANVFLNLVWWRG